MLTSAAHRLDPLLRPRSVALLGASTRSDSPGNDMVRMALARDHGCAVWPVNPKYEQIEGVTCYASLDDLPGPPDQVAIALGNERLEAALKSAIAAGARAVTVLASAFDPHDPELPSRLAATARDAGTEMCGVNCMGFYNIETGLRVCGFASALDMTPGGIAWISQSGSVFGALAHNDRRPRFNICVSSGAETVTTAADYLDWAVRQSSTRVAGLFLETVRDPQGFERALGEAAARGIPVVILKVGRTEASARMALTHTGAIAGNDGAYEALFRHYGVIRVRTMDEMAATLLLLQDGTPVGPGGLATMHDSGGERELIADIADDLKVPFAEISGETVARLAANLDPGLKPENPLDAWGTGRAHEQQFTACLAALIGDPNVAAAGMFVNLRDGYYLHETNARLLKAVRAGTRKPVFLATNYAMVRHETAARALTEAGVPVLDGTEEALLAVRHLFAWRDHQAQAYAAPQPADETVVAKWRARLSSAEPLDEADALDLLDAFGVATPKRARAHSRDGVLAAAAEVGWPLVLKTAMPGIHHKSDVGGVALGLGAQADLVAAYDDMAARLGPEVLVSAMAGRGTELALGALFDDQFGPAVMISAGGTLVELIEDRVFVRAPAPAAQVRALIETLKVARLLAGVRGAPPADMDALALSVERFSVMAAALADCLCEADLNPLIATPQGAVALDALVIPRKPKIDGLHAH
jgi:acyl-CoA synthetase (NDP forming)